MIDHSDPLSPGGASERRSSAVPRYYAVGNYYQGTVMDGARRVSIATVNMAVPGAKTQSALDGACLLADLLNQSGEPAETRAVLQEPPWQSIETYPDDTEYRLLYSSAHGHVIGAHVTGDVWHLVGVGCITSASERPKLWAQLPDVPAPFSPDPDTAPSHLILLAEDGADKCWGCRDCSAKVWTSAEPSIYWHSRECPHYGKMDTAPS